MLLKIVTTDLHTIPKHKDNIQTIALILVSVTWFILSNHGN